MCIFFFFKFQQNRYSLLIALSVYFNWVCVRMYLCGYGVYRVYICMRQNIRIIVKFIPQFEIEIKLEFDFCVQYLYTCGVILKILVRKRNFNKKKERKKKWKQIKMRAVTRCVPWLTFSFTFSPSPFSCWLLLTAKYIENLRMNWEKKMLLNMKMTDLKNKLRKNDWDECILSLIEISFCSPWHLFDVGMF